MGGCVGGSMGGSGQITKNLINLNNIDYSILFEDL